jgi:two-component system sensor histidine kinase KdpD
MATDDDDVTAHVPPARGCHKVFLGYAAGVGKTYTMLSEAQRRHGRGEDLVIGFVEPHRRPETQALMEGLERIPPKLISYRGAEFEELDTAAVLERHPHWVLVDELAHTNVPGTEHAKRWQSVDELLDAGISVVSTVNVQHFESLNDTVAQITGVCMRETLPDRILEEADEVVLIDITPEALLNRLKRGVIYEPEKVPRALANFFRKGNLVALRELALRKAAEEVDEELTEFIEQHDVDKTWGVQERVLVSITPRPLGAKLIRRGHRLAKRMNGRFWAVFVRAPGLALSAKEEQSLQDLFTLALDLGGLARDAQHRHRGRGGRGPSRTLRSRCARGRELTPVGLATGTALSRWTPRRTARILARLIEYRSQVGPLSPRGSAWSPPCGATEGSCLVETNEATTRTCGRPRRSSSGRPKGPAGRFVFVGLTR